MKLTDKDFWILEYLKDKDFVSPTEIGYNYGLNNLNRNDCHSSTASKNCIKLVELGKLERNKKGHYKLKT